MIQRDLKDWLDYLEQLHPIAIDMGLDRSRMVAQRLALGKLAARVITVTGTNGKGSTCAFIANLLKEQGLRVGVYSSPHLLRYNERVVIGGVIASDDALCTAFSAVDAARGDISLTYFEMGTLAAFWLFMQEQLDAVVLEVGLGGRLDAVNLVDPDISVITNIGLDHAEWLGDTRDSVAREKAGIFRECTFAVCGDKEPPAAIVDTAYCLSAPLLISGRDFDWRQEADHWSWEGRSKAGESLCLPALPLLELPIANAALAIQVFALLGLPWQAELIVKALQSTCVPGRLERRCVIWQGKSVSFLLDVGHNSHAACFLASHLKKVTKVRHAVFGLLADKDLAGVVEPMLDLVVDWVVCTLPTARSRPAKELAAFLAGRGAQVSMAGAVAQALEEQCRHACPDDEILVFGSFYCVAEALSWLEQQR